MQINISARHGNLSVATQEKITAKVEKLPRLFDRMTAIQVTVDLERRDAPRVELCVSAEHSEHFFADDHSGNLMAALDGALHKVEKQVRKHKDKLMGHRSPGLKRLETLLQPQTP